MRIMKILIISMIGLCIMGCWTLSVHPLYTNDDLIFDEALIGTWGDPAGEDEETWKFEKSDGAYKLIVRNTDADHSFNDPFEDCYSMLEYDPRTDGVFEVHLLKLGEYMFLDIFPEEPEIGNEVFLSHVIPAHSFMQIKIEGDTLNLAFFETDWLEKSIEEGRLDIEYTERDNIYVLTSSSDKLQKIILENIDEVFPEFDGLVRLK
jgi:hypothetical protein